MSNQQTVYSVSDTGRSYVCTSRSYHVSCVALLLQRQTNPSFTHRLAAIQYSGEYNIPLLVAWSSRSMCKAYGQHVRICSCPVPVPGALNDPSVVRPSLLSCRTSQSTLGVSPSPAGGMSSALSFGFRRPLSLALRGLILRRFSSSSTPLHCETFSLLLC